MTLKLDKALLNSIDARQFNKSKSNSAYTKTILAGRLDEAFKRFEGPFSFVYEAKKSDYGWHPSGDCLPSVTKLWEKANAALSPQEGAPVGKDLRHLNKVFMVGHYWHQIIQHIIVQEQWAQPSAIENIAYRCWNESANFARTYIVDEHHKDAPVDPDSAQEALPFHYVRGQGDVAPLTVGGWSGLVDIKTMNPSDFKGGLAQSRFSKKYTAQINIYMDLFDLDQAMILAVDKGSSAFAEYTFVRDDTLIDEIYRKWERVSELLVSGEAPHRKRRCRVRTIYWR